MTQTTWAVGNNRKQEVTLVAPTAEIAELAGRIYDEAASEDGIIGAGDMVRYFPGQPTLHTDTKLYNAMLAAGCEIADSYAD